MSTTSGVSTLDKPESVNFGNDTSIAYKTRYHILECSKKKFTLLNVIYR